MLIKLRATIILKKLNHFKPFQFYDISGKLDKLNSHDDGQVLLRRQGPIGTTNAIQGWGSEKFIQSSRWAALDWINFCRVGWMLF